MQRKEESYRWNSLAVEIGFHSVCSVDGGGQLSAESQYELYKSSNSLAMTNKKFLH